MVEAEPSFITRVFDFGLALWHNWWLLVTGGVLVIEPMIEMFVPQSWKDPIDRLWPKETRHKNFRWAAAAALLIASFFAFDDVSTRNRALQKDIHQAIGARDEALHERDENVSPAIDRLSGDLTNARGQIDTQARQIGEQKAELEKLLNPPRDPTGIYVAGQKIGIGRDAKLVNNRMEFLTIETRVPLSIGDIFEFGAYRLRFVGAGNSSVASIPGGLGGATYSNTTADVVGRREGDK